MAENFLGLTKDINLDSRNSANDKKENFKENQAQIIVKMLKYKNKNMNGYRFS